MMWNETRLGVVGVLVAALAGCGSSSSFDATDPASGPGELVGHADALNQRFEGGASPETAPRPGGSGDFQDCDDACRAYCAAQDFQNPIDKAICPALWGAGLDTLPFVETEACRRMFVDTRGRFPSYEELLESCLGRPVGDAALAYLSSEEFVLGGQRRYADVLGYNNVAVSVERIYDADKLVGKLHMGLLRYDEFVEVISAHPVFTRRLNDAGDRAEALFSMFVGRPPFANERADMAKLYALWNNGYHDHPAIGMRFPDAYIEHRCVGPDGRINESTAGACTSVLWGFNRVALLPDFRTIGGLTWSGNLTAEEWRLLQTPGRILGTWPEVWEHMVSEVLELYLGYDLGKYTPRVVKELVEYVLRHGGDVRAAHYAVLTSALYLQSSECSSSECEGSREALPWTFGPLKQAEAEQWIDSINYALHADAGVCDHRMPDPDALLDGSVRGHELVAVSRWRMVSGPRGTSVDRRYADLAQTLGGCPDNLTAGRFKAVSILNTATQEAFVADLCNPIGAEGRGVPGEVLLPGGLASNTALDEEVAVQVVAHQVGQFFARLPSEEEISMVEAAATRCVPKPCTAESFARGLCYSLLSSSEMLFY